MNGPPSVSNRYTRTYRSGLFGIGTGMLQIPGLTRSTGGRGPTERALTDTVRSGRGDQPLSGLYHVTGGDAGPVHQLGRSARARCAANGEMGDARRAGLVRQRFHDCGPEPALGVVVLDDD